MQDVSFQLCRNFFLEKGRPQFQRWQTEAVKYSSGPPVLLHRCTALHKVACLHYWLRDYRSIKKRGAEDPHPQESRARRGRR